MALRTTVLARLGDNGVEEGPRERTLARVQLLWGSRNLAPALDEAVTTFRREPGALSSLWEEVLQSSSPPALPARGGDPPRTSPRCCAGSKCITSPGTWHPACISRVIPSSPATQVWCLNPRMPGHLEHMHKEGVAGWWLHSTLPIIRRHLPRGALSSTRGADPPISRLQPLQGRTSQVGGCPQG